MIKFLGNKPVRLLLQQGIRRDALAAAYIFAGPAGVGKKLLALLLAKSLNCLAGGGDLDCCGSCASCRKIDTGNHPDVQLIVPDTKVLKVDQIRSLIQEINFRPFEGRRRVFILDDADRMNEEAANCLLKTLEEPPEKSILVLITASLYALLPTIRSRGQILNFRPIPAPEIEEYLRAERSFPPDRATVAARVSTGSLGRALSLDMDAFASLQKETFELLELLTRADDAALLSRFRSIFGPEFKRVDVDLFLQIFVSILRDLVIMEHFRDREHITHYEQLNLLIALRHHFTMEIVEKILHELEEMGRKSHINLKPDVYLLNCLLRYRAVLLWRSNHAANR